MSFTFTSFYDYSYSTVSADAQGRVAGNWFPSTNPSASVSKGSGLSATVTFKAPQPDGTGSSCMSRLVVSNACGEQETIDIAVTDSKPNYVFECENDPCEGSFDYEAQSSSLGLMTSTKNGEPIGCSLTGNTGSSWLSVTGPIQSGVPTLYAFTVQVKQNTSSSSRSCTLTFTQNESGKTIQYPITQTGAGNCQIDGTVTYDANASGSLTFNNFRVLPGHTCGSSFSSAQVIFTIFNGTFTTSSSAYYTVSSDGKSATVTVNTTGRSFTIPYRKTGTADVHISGERSSGGSSGNCPNGCDLIYDISG